MRDYFHAVASEASEAERVGDGWWDGCVWLSVGLPRRARSLSLEWFCGTSQTVQGVQQRRGDPLRSRHNQPGEG
jgi:hypothetical protein